MYLLHNFLADNVKQFFKCPRNTVYFTIITALENFLSEQLGNSPLVPRTNILSNEYNICMYLTFINQLIPVVCIPFAQ